MGDSRKTKKDLIAELAEMRARVASLEEALESGIFCSDGQDEENCFDILTGLPNRLPFYNFVKHAVAQAARRRQVVAVLVFSLDRFRFLNENLGKNAGDHLLKEVAERLKYCLRKSDVLARPGWDEFAILLPEIARVEDATVVVERIFDTLDAPFHLQGNTHFINAGIGISLYPHDGSDPGALINNAYTAMKRAKEERKNDFRYYSPQINSRAVKGMLMENSLRMALKREEIYFHYQPQVDISNGDITGMEALLRWTHPEMGIVDPEEFIPLMEDIGMTSSLSDWALYTACNHNRECRKSGYPPLRTCINLSSRQLLQKDLVRTVDRVLNETGIDPGMLELEITESDIIRNIEATSLTLGQLSRMGVQLAIDDFGKGYSSLSYLRYFPFDRLKIDKIFVDDLAIDQSNAAIASAIATLAHNLGLGVVAEGVETVEQLQFLRGLQCDSIQGYLFSRPLTPFESLSLLKEKISFDKNSSPATYGTAQCDRFWLGYGARWN